MKLQNSDKQSHVRLAAGRARGRCAAIVWVAVLILVGWLIIVNPALAQTGGEYKLISWTIDNGGSTELAGGEYRLMSTAGQFDAEKEILAGGDYMLLSGVWPSDEPITRPELYLPTILK